MELYELTAHQASALLSRGEISSVELTTALLDRTARVDGAIHAYLALFAERALADAARADAARADARRRGAVDGLSPLLGVPVAVKDVICVAGGPTTCGSRILEGFQSPYEATVVERLRAAGAVLTGKTNTDEFAMGSSSENSAYGTTRNPWDLTRVPGGSSGGSAAAVAAQMVPLALGSDTGGSVRQPASLCGVVGIKPSYGRVSRYGLVAYASSLDQIGALGRDVTDAALLLSAIAGHDPRDSTSMPTPVPDYARALVADLRGMRVGLPVEYMSGGVQPAVTEAVHAAIVQLEALGAEVREISLPHTDYALPVYYVIAPAECSANLSRYDGMRYGLSASDAPDVWEVYRQSRERGFGAEVKRRIMLGTFALSAGYYDAFYLKAQKVRTLIRQDFDRAFQEVDVVVGPTSPTTAFKVGERVDDPLSMYMSDVYTLSCNLAGICGLSLPCGFADRLPIGLHIQGPAFDEESVLRVAYAYEQATEWHFQHPMLGGL
ncbi:MAG: Asp-tRNA(Asn)/Glu-tRNA(Gln) amidotransferase subunit GatA [Anaerolineae bacterium]|nr:Asp-tRNA(Asn)/Glu-tRNA(Gln) amidotransferase subunit GatA [Anaerolineae bacterium]